MHEKILDIRDAYDDCITHINRIDLKLKKELVRIY